MTPLEIAIVGAGPVGCMLARLLLLQDKSRLRVTVFEAEASPNYRSQGGTLDLHPKEGIVALKAGLLFDEFVKNARYDGEAIRVTDKNLKTFVSSPPSTNEGDSRGAPEIDRFHLRRILTESLPADVIRWGWRLARVELDPKDEAEIGNSVRLPAHRLHFDGGRILTGYHLVVGADGAFSRVREALAPFSSKGKKYTEVGKPQYVGIAGFRFSISDAAKSAPDVYKLVNRGSVFSFSDGKGITGQQMGDGSIWVGAMGIKGEAWIKEQETKQQHDQRAQDRHHVGAWYKQALLSDYQDWHPELRAFIEKGDDSAGLLPLYSLPDGFRWNNKPGITAIGDAAHLMVPYAGQGVNIGLRDALELSRAICSALAADEGPGAEMLHQTLSCKIASFESDMFCRAHAAQAASNGMMKAMLFTPGAPRTSIHTWLGWLAKQKFSPWLYPFFLVAVYVYFAIWRLWDGTFRA
ncbi:hypothetical protein HDK77DRAFT_110835 [Phyllosticta capitalensis]|uniref:FAD-binding domain-containing protein n=1 Tax=Phyllosticta capitalensis TaxID=121624 RepID=A0ABR1YPY3_9PEZI